ncbi:hypothetical protein SDC9_65040 [bioreactor metagenome]|uniref:Phage portal protein n=1 Tax=bioreactor metagenome TaxID=1076179 RepID=A0A644XRT9_9ZZZZ
MTVSKIINLLNGGSSILSVSKNLYDIPEIRTAINIIAETIGSVPFYHVRADQEGNIDYLNDHVQYVMSVRTNPLQGPQVFWTHTITKLLLCNNAYIFPDWDENGNLRALYPLPFTTHQMGMDGDHLVITFNASRELTFPYDDIIHLQRFPAQNGGERRQATGNYTQMIAAMEEQAVKDSANSDRIAAIMQFKTALKGEALKKKLDEFKELFMTSENTTGFGMIGGDYEVKNLDLKKTPLNKDLLESIVGYMYNYFGVSKGIITHSASELEYEQYIEYPIKPIIWQIEEELTYKLFSRTEIGRYNKIQAELVDLEISTLSAKTAFYKEMVYGTIMNRNEIRKRIGLKRGPAELDKFLGNKNFETLEPGNYVVEKGGEKDGQETPSSEPAV